MRRVGVALGLLSAVLLIGIGADGILLAERIHHVKVHFPAAGDGTTWVIAGSDSRSNTLPGSNPSQFGSAEQVPGARADVVIVVHRYAHSTHVLSIPRDLLVSPTPGVFERLTLTLLGGPQQLIDGLCTTLGIPATHLVIVDFSAFASIVDALGGVTVSLPAPIRDSYAALLIPTVPPGGRVHLDGTQALALVRSRTPQWRVGSRWVTVPDGAQQRTAWAGRLMDAIVGAIRRNEDHPVVMQRIAYAATGSLTTDSGTGLRALAGLRNADTAATPLPAAAIANTLAVDANAATRAGLAAAGYRTRCLTHSSFPDPLR